VIEYIYLKDDIVLHFKLVEIKRIFMSDKNHLNV